MTHMRNTRQRRVATFRNTYYEVRNTFHRFFLGCCGVLLRRSRLGRGVFFVPAGEKHLKLFFAGGEKNEVVCVFGAAGDVFLETI